MAYSFTPAAAADIPAVCELIQKRIDCTHGPLLTAAGIGRLVADEGSPALDLFQDTHGTQFVISPLDGTLGNRQLICQLLHRRQLLPRN